MSMFKGLVVGFLWGGIISAVVTLVLSLATMQPAGRMADDAAMPRLAETADPAAPLDAVNDEESGGATDAPAAGGDAVSTDADFADAGTATAADLAQAQPAPADPVADPAGGGAGPAAAALTELDPVIAPDTPETEAAATPRNPDDASVPDIPASGPAAPSEQDLPDAPPADAAGTVARPEALELALAPEPPGPLPGAPVLDAPRDAAPDRGERAAVAPPVPEALPLTETAAPSPLDLPVPEEPLSRLLRPGLPQPFAPLALDVSGPDPALSLRAAMDLPRPRDEAQPQAAETTPAPPAPASEPAAPAPEPEDGAAPADEPPAAEPAEPAEPEPLMPAPEVETDPPGGFAESDANPAPVVRAPVASGGRVGLGLPQVSSFGIDDNPGLPSEPAAGDGAETVEAEEPATDLPALERFAAEFDADESRALLAILLVAEPGVPVDVAALADLPLPVSVALDPRASGSTSTARDLRAAGAETLVYLAGQVGPDMALQPALAALPESVAFLDGPDAALQSDRDALDVVLAQMQESGHGLVAYPRGFNTAERSASRDGLRAVTLFRDLGGLSDAELRRVLDRAGVAAGVEGAVVVTAPLRADVLASLVSWSLGDRSDAVALAPVSAVLVRR